jgi:hypothetical protein
VWGSANGKKTVCGVSEQMASPSSEEIVYGNSLENMMASSGDPFPGNQAARMETPMIIVEKV